MELDIFPGHLPLWLLLVFGSPLPKWVEWVIFHMIL